MTEDGDTRKAAAADSIFGRACMPAIQLLHTIPRDQDCSLSTFLTAPMNCMLGETLYQLINDDCCSLTCSLRRRNDPAATSLVLIVATARNTNSRCCHIKET